jgi:hypothetical protein
VGSRGFGVPPLLTAVGAMEVDERLRFRVLSRGASPLIFEPDIDWRKFRGSNIIHLTPGCLLLVRRTCS